MAGSTTSGSAARSSTCPGRPRSPRPRPSRRFATPLPERLSLLPGEGLLSVQVAGGVRGADTAPGVLGCRPAPDSGQNQQTLRQRAGVVSHEDPMQLPSSGAVEILPGRDGVQCGHKVVLL